MFREPAEIVHATTTPFVPPPDSGSQSTQKDVLHDRPTATNAPYLPRVHAALVRLVGSSLPTSQRGYSSRSRGRGDRLSFQTGTLSRPAIYRASLAGDQAAMKRRLRAVKGKKFGCSIRLKCVVRSDGEEKGRRCCVQTKEEKVVGIRVEKQQCEINRISKEMSWILWPIWVAGGDCCAAVFWSPRPCPVLQVVTTSCSQQSKTLEVLDWPVTWDLPHRTPQAGPDLDLTHCGSRLRGLKQKHAICVVAGVLVAATGAGQGTSRGSGEERRSKHAGRVQGRLERHCQSCHCLGVTTGQQCQRLLMSRLAAAFTGTFLAQGMAEPVLAPGSEASNFVFQLHHTSHFTTHNTALINNT